MDSPLCAATVRTACVCLLLACSFSLLCLFFCVAQWLPRRQRDGQPIHILLYEDTNRHMRGTRARRRGTWAGSASEQKPEQMGQAFRRIQIQQSSHTALISLLTVRVLYVCHACVVFLSPRCVPRCLFLFCSLSCLGWSGYTESQKSPDTDPLIWWSNGGPGCSGLLGFLTEHGPFRTSATSGGLDPFPFAWNTLANTLYVEAPAGVGFSFSDNPNDYTTGDARTAADNFEAIKQFLIRFPHLQTNDFYISAESYGGHYVPTLAQVIVNEGTLPSFKGFLLGNPLTDMDENANCELNKQTRNKRRKEKKEKPAAPLLTWIFLFFSRSVCSISFLSFSVFF